MECSSANTGSIAGEPNWRCLDQIARKQLLHDIEKVGLLDTKLLRQLTAKDATRACPRNPLEGSLHNTSP